MAEKQRVISILCGLIGSNGRKDATPLRELQYEYCELESTREIPCFEHKGIIDFLVSSGEFTVNVESNGLVTVRVKPKSSSSELLCVSAEQKTRPLTGSAVLKTVKRLMWMNQKQENQEPPSVPEIELKQWKATERNVLRVSTRANIEIDPTVNHPVHTLKPSNVYTLSQVKESLNPFIPAQQEPLHVPFGEKVTTRDRNNTKENGDTMDPLSQGNHAKYVDSFNELNRMCVNFSKSLRRDAQNKYWSVLEIDHVQYLGEGNTGDEANDNAASKYLKSIDTGVHRNRANQAYARDVVPNVSIIKLHEMYGELDYRTVVVRTGERNKFKTTIQVDSVDYYGRGKSFQQAAANAADACLLSIKQGLHSKIASSGADLSRCKRN